MMLSFLTACIILVTNNTDIANQLIQIDSYVALTRLGKNSVPRADPKFHSSKFITCFTNNGVQCTKFFWSKIKI